MSNSWIRGENVPERPMPEAVERLRVFQKATAVILTPTPNPNPTLTPTPNLTLTPTFALNLTLTRPS